MVLNSPLIGPYFLGGEWHWEVPLDSHEWRCFLDYLHSLKLTVRTWTLMIGILYRFLLGRKRPIFRGENAVSFRECIPWDHSGHPQNLSISLAKAQVDSESKMPVVLQPMLGWFEVFGQPIWVTKMLVVCKKSQYDATRFQGIYIHSVRVFLVGYETLKGGAMKKICCKAFCRNLRFTFNWFRV